MKGICSGSKKILSNNKTRNYIELLNNCFQKPVLQDEHQDALSYGLVSGEPSFKQEEIFHQDIEEMETRNY